MLVFWGVFSKREAALKKTTRSQRLRRFEAVEHEDSVIGSSLCLEIKLQRRNWTTRLNRQRKWSRWGSVGFGWLSGWVSLGMVNLFFLGTCSMLVGFFGS